MRDQPIEPLAVHIGRVVFILDQLTQRIRFLERSLTLLVFALFLMTSCNVMIILRVFEW